MGKENAAHEIVIFLKDTKTLESSGAIIKEAFPTLLVENYRGNISRYTII